MQYYVINKTDGESPEKRKVHPKLMVLDDSIIDNTHKRPDYFGLRETVTQ